MPKTKNETDLVPRSLQQAFLWIAAASFILNAIDRIIILSRVYSQRDFRLSQFSVMTLSDILLPILFFGTAYIFVRASTSRTGHLFMSALLAAAGVMLHRLFTLLDWAWISALTPAANQLDLAWRAVALAAISLAAYAALILFIMFQKNRLKAARSVLLVFAGAALTSYVITALTALAKPEYGGGALIASLPITLTHFVQIALPVAFAGIAYFGLSKKMRLRDQVTHLVLATTIGTLVFQSVFSIDMIVRQLPGAEEFIWPHSFILAGSLSLLVYVAIFALYRTYDRRKH